MNIRAETTRITMNCQHQLSTIRQWQIRHQQRYFKEKNKLLDSMDDSQGTVELRKLGFKCSDPIPILNPKNNHGHFYDYQDYWYIK